MPTRSRRRSITAIAGALTLFVSARAVPSGDDQRAATAAITKLVEDWDQGWRTFDAALATRDYAPDADWTNAFGDSRKGQPEIQRFMTKLYTDPKIRSRRSTPSKTTIRFIRPDIAAVSSYRETVGQKTASGAEYPTRKTHDLRIVVREAGNWLIVSHLIMDEKEVHP
jgi:uncharacterized protein (TIGR02246 family)